MIQRILLILWMNGLLMAWGQGNIMETTVSIQFQNTPLSECLRQLKQESTIPIAYRSDHPAMKSRVSAKFEQENLANVLQSILRNTPFTYKRIGQTITIYEKGNRARSSLQDRDSKKFITLSGYIQALESQEKIIGATLYIPDLQIGTYSNSFGFFSLRLPVGNHTLIVRSPNHEQQTFTLQLERDERMTIEMIARTIDAVEINAITASDILTPEIGTQQLSIEEIKKIPALLGEVDVIKAIQFLPGVQAGPDGTSNLLVRGGGPGQNLILLDDVPLYYLNHAGGLVSVFQANTLKQVKLTKGGFPARYGGRLSSVMDIRLREGDMKEFHGSVGIGLLSSHISLEGPIHEGKTSFLFSARRSFADLLLRPYARIQTAGTTGAGYTFFDVTAKLNHIFSDKDRLFLSLYLGNDRVSWKNDDTFDDILTQDVIQTENRWVSSWGNQIMALRWNHLWGSKAFSNLTATFSRYGFGAGSNFQEQRFAAAGSGQEDALGSSEFDYLAQVEDWGLKWDMEFFPQPQHTIRSGAQLTYHQFQPGSLDFASSFEEIPVDTSFISPQINRLEAAFYVEEEWAISPSFQLNAGLHLNAYQIESGFQWNLQPRLTTSLKLSPQIAWKVGLTRMRQNLHLLANNTLGLPVDFWVPATEQVPSQDMSQASSGIHADIQDGKWQVSVEGFYREMSGLIEYKEGSNFFENFFGSDWQNNVETNGRGTVWGLEFFLKKNVGKTQGWISYTLSKNTRQFDNINAGQPFPFRFDQRHYANLIIQHQLKPNVSLNLNWVIHTGRAYTLSYAQSINPLTEQGLPTSLGSFTTPNTYEPAFDSPLTTELLNPVGQLFPLGRNGSRYPLYHRMDIGASFEKEKKHGIRTWRVGLYNAYNRLNPLSIYLGRTSFNQPELRSLVLFPLLPSISYNFEF